MALPDQFVAVDPDTGESYTYIREHDHPPEVPNEAAPDPVEVPAVEVPVEVADDPGIPASDAPVVATDDPDPTQPESETLATSFGESPAGSTTSSSEPSSPSVPVGEGGNAGPSAFDQAGLDLEDAAAATEDPANGDDPDAPANGDDPDGPHSSVETTPPSTAGF